MIPLTRRVEKCVDPDQLASQKPADLDLHSLSKQYLFDLILYVPVNNLSVCQDNGSIWVEPVLSKDKCVLLKDTTQRPRFQNSTYLGSARFKVGLPF